jgi:acyl-CoA synthetase (AMP-forming)/AMP-acid ligase II
MPSLLRISDVVACGAARFADRPALDEGGRAITYAGLERRVAASATSLASLGIRAGERVLVVADNCVDALVLLFAIGRLDAWPVLASARLGAGEIDGIALHAGPRVVLHLSNSSDAAAAHAARRGAVRRDVAPHGSLHLERPAGDPCPEPTPDRPGQGIAVLLYTSGTSGAPKAAMLTHANVLFVAQAQVLARRYHSDDRVWCALESRGHVPRVEFGDPDFVLAIETLGENAGLALLSRDLRRDYEFIRVR